MGEHSPGNGEGADAQKGAAPSIALLGGMERRQGIPHRQVTQRPLSGRHARKVIALPSPAFRKALEDARSNAIRHARLAGDVATDPETAMSLCRAAGRYAERARHLQIWGAC